MNLVLVTRHVTASLVQSVIDHALGRDHRYVHSILASLEMALVPRVVHVTALLLLARLEMTVGKLLLSKLIEHHSLFQHFF